MCAFSYSGAESVLGLGLGMLIYSIIVWCRAVATKPTYEGHYTGLVQIGLRYRILLLTVSEVIFFLAFFLGIFPFKFSPNCRDWSNLASKGN